MVVLQWPIIPGLIIVFYTVLFALNEFVKRQHTKAKQEARDNLLQILKNSESQTAFSSHQLKTPPSIDDTLLEQLEQVNHQLRDTPNNLDFLREKAKILSDLERHRDYKDVSDKIDEIVSREEFNKNLSQAITIQSLEVRELEFFGSFFWNFPPDIAVLLGKNGYGKSHLLSLIIALLQKDKKILKRFFPAQSSREASVKLTVVRNGKPDVIHFTKLGFEESIGKIPVLAISELRFVDKSKDNFTKEDIGDDTDSRTEAAYRFLRHIPMGPIIQNFILALCIAYGKLSKEDKQDFQAPYYQPVFIKSFARSHQRNLSLRASNK